MSNIENTASQQRKEQIIQFVKYCLVGGLNSLITLVLIYVCKSFLGVNLYVSNAIGYVGGLINSFLWNKAWVFKSKGGYSKEALKFICGFAVCYALQILVVWLLNQSSFGALEYSFSNFTITGYGIATLIGMVVYTVANFVYNRLITFK
jgi:putative flippase GtrA